MDAVELLRQILAIPSLSGEEEKRADFLTGFLQSQGLSVRRVKNNILARVDCSDSNAPVLMLNSHLDTVRPVGTYSSLPTSEDCVPGLGSNDAGGALVSMIATALHFHRYKTLDFNLLLLISAEEETSGKNGMSLAISEVGRVDCAIIGEPTMMRAAIGERGLLVLDGLAQGVSGHAARNEGVNAIYIALDDIVTLRNYRFHRLSPLMGEVKISVTQITAGTQHNVVPDECRFVVDVRPTDVYSNEEIWHELQNVVKSTLTPRSLRNRSSATPVGHPLAECARALGIETYISPTTSDWMRIGNIPAIKMGPGDSARSHTANEYITITEIESGIAGYIDFLNNMLCSRRLK